MYGVLIVAVAICLLVVAARSIRKKNIDIIAVQSLKRKRIGVEGLNHVFFCFVDHFEPFWAGADEATALERVEDWVKYYPASVDRFRDKGGKPPIHSFFYPQEEYAPRLLDMLAELENSGYGRVEVHLHHDGDTSSSFREKINSFKETLHSRHGMLHKDPVTGTVEYGFIHGNWALDDSGIDGRWCGVKDEITILKETGCYADFTYPSAPHPTQPPVINRVYYATDDPKKGKSHHRGVDAAFGAAPRGDLLLITGPLAFNWQKRRRGVLPAIENGDITGVNLPTGDRIDLWIRLGISVEGWPRWIFVKVHTHGVQPKNAKLLLGERIAPMYDYLLSKYNDGKQYLTHFVSARELYLCVKALESADNDWIARIENFDYSG
ncbi:MAG: hypothetical protein GTO51_06655 [Candidatus Latescibacteria bacterium]|nr:hypothetical protein [Candidatus Latescibacterota bacterium]NIM21483.1 hypothetical protein [Candidatus Latescibacterota bacterium]NIM65654.1 hypothetical protein [Candidatus Latescibacterota bacterium]NIO02036.1 hypothetical protein [Candidatus Latescibacterota bacterium]NIO28848.1 hypothetical protein [Candidatus Latescibacterota bacterium]